MKQREYLGYLTYQDSCVNGPPNERLRKGQEHSAVIFAGDATRSPTPPSVEALDHGYTTDTQK